MYFFNKHENVKTVLEFGLALGFIWVIFNFNTLMCRELYC